YDWLWKCDEERAYFEALYDYINNSDFANSVVFDPHGDDMQVWFSKIGYILSTSEHEGSHQAVAEGMAAGSIPVIRNWHGADELYPEEFVVRSVDEAVGMILGFNESQDFSLKTDFVRKFARENFDLPVIFSSYERLFRKLLNESHDQVFQNPNHILTKTGGIVKVIHVCYLNAGSQSGYEVRVIEETSALVRQGIELYLVVFLARKWFFQVEHLNDYKKKLEEMTHADVVFFPTDHFFDLTVNDAMVREIDEPLIEFARLHDVKIFHGQALYSTRNILRAARVTGAKVVFDVHGASPEETAMTGGSPERVAKTTEFEKLALSQSDLRIMVSGQMNSYLREKYSLSDLPFQLIPCCVRSNEFHMTAKDRVRLRNLKGFNNKVVFLYLGTLSAWQWPEAMFSLFSHFYKANSDAILYLLIPEYDHAKAGEYIKKYDLPPESYLLEEVAHNEVGKVIGMADAGLLLRESHPVNFVSSPTKFGEYLAAGVPVILTEGIGDYSSMATEMQVGITLKIDDKEFPEDEQEKLRLFAQEVMQNREKWADRCMKTAEEMLDWKVYIEKLVRQYSKLTDQK
ncbi:MAG TPA: glycosyltransferase, partial [Prolixibacteraceae bacterium]|nr:glycosyltransferase [Prolixibacteraceae bacterium]